MKLKLKRKWWITSDENQFAITKIVNRKNSKTGEMEEVKTYHGYFMSFTKALRYFYNNQELKSIEAETLEGFIKEYSKIKREFEQLINKLEV